jgi:hypothetical protein
VGGCCAGGAEVMLQRQGLTSWVCPLGCDGLAAVDYEDKLLAVVAQAYSSRSCPAAQVLSSGPRRRVVRLALLWHGCRPKLQAGLRRRCLWSLPAASSMSSQLGGSRALAAESSQVLLTGCVASVGAGLDTMTSETGWGSLACRHVGAPEGSRLGGALKYFRGWLTGGRPGALCVRRPGLREDCIATDRGCPKRASGGWFSVGSAEGL